jgi:UDPglucose 6-dehydrogenase
MTITFVGHGYVGIVTACVFADLGNTVYVIGRDEKKLDKLKSGNPIIYEPGLAELLKKNIDSHRMIFTKSYKEALENSEIVFIAVGTPPKKTGEADLSSVLAVAENIGKNLKKGYTVVSCKSTVPIGTNKKVLEILKQNKQEGATVDVASCPEFLREGTALHDTFNPDRVVIGSESKKAQEKIMELHKNIPGERVLVGIESAEIIKYASNSFLATKISFANLISFISEKAGADVEEILDGVGIDKRIGRVFLYPGVGYGGSCFPKDVKALVKTGEALNVDMRLLQAVDDINDQAKDNYIEKVINNLPGKNIAIWGLAFKPNTDDIREAPATYIIDKLLIKDFKIKAYDPEAMKNVEEIYKDKIKFCKKPLEAVDNADGLLILTEWNEFKQIDLEKVKEMMKTPIIFDGRNIYDKKNMLKLGFKYFSVGR